MSTTDKLTEENSEALALQQAAELQQQIHYSLQKLSLERLQMVADFAGYLVDKEVEEATQEIQEIPGVVETLQHNRRNPSQFASWRNLRSDV